MAVLAHTIKCRFATSGWMVACLALFGCGNAIGRTPKAASLQTVATAPSPDPMPLRRLSTEELNNTFSDLLGDDSQPARVLPAQGRGVHGFFEPGSVSVVDAEHLLSMVEGVAANAVRDLPKLLQCGPTVPVTTGDQELCVRGFIARFGRRAFRRPLGSDDVALYVRRYRAALASPDASFKNGVRLVLQEMLFSPNFLYHGELGSAEAPAPGVVPDPPVHLR